MSKIDNAADQVKHGVDKAAEEYQAALALDPRNKVASESLKKLQKK